MNGFVHIVESPSSADLLDGRTEGRSLNEALALAGIRHWYSLATDRATFDQAIGERLAAAWHHHQQPPILHFSMHGNQDGVVLTSGEFISWHDLRQLLLPLIRVMQGGLLICMSSCFGSSGCRMAMYADNEPPFWALVGNTDSASWSDAAVAYITFYHLFFKGFDLDTCVGSMRVGSGDHNFIAQSGHETKQNWVEFIQQRIAQVNQGLEQATGSVQDNTVETPPNP